MSNLKWGIDNTNTLSVLADELHLKVSYAVFKENQYILSKLDLAGKMRYCACRISGDTIMLTGNASHDVTVCLSNPESIDILEKWIKDDRFMMLAGYETEQAIIQRERRDCSLDHFIASINGITY